jgi:bacterioferritin (cytochrome b1)
MPTVSPNPVKTSEKAEEMLRFDLENENETVRNYRQRIRQAEALGEYALAEDLRQILVEEQDHQISLATALGIDVPAEGLGRQSGKATQIAEVKQVRSAAEVRHDAAVKANATRKATQKG